MRHDPAPFDIDRPISVRPLGEQDLAEADRVFRQAFGTFIGLPDPMTFGGDADYVRTRWRADPSAAFGAYLGDVVVGSNFAANWGSVGFFGPLTIRPERWDRGIGKRLVEAVMGRFDEWGTRHAGLFTFAHSQKHVGLYQRFGFWPRFLTSIMAKPVDPARAGARAGAWTRLTGLSEAERARRIADCRELTDAIYAGLDVSSEIRSVAGQQLGDTLLLWRNGRLSGLAVCHCGTGTEAGSGACYVKFGAVRPSGTSPEDFDLLLTACEELAAELGAGRLAAGVNAARQEAYIRLQQRGFRTEMQGVAMQRPNEDGYNRPGVYVLDDWR